MYAAVVETHQHLLAATPASRLTRQAIDGQSLSQARSELQHFERLVAGGGHERAADFLQRGMQQLATTRYHDWRTAAGAFTSPVASPLCVSFFTLPAHYAMSQRLRSATWGPNSLAGGDFEERATPAVQRLAQPDRPAAGCVHRRRTVTPRAPLRTLVAARPVLADAAGTDARLLRVSTDFHHQRPRPRAGRTDPADPRLGARPDPIQGSLDGLLIYDSLGGSDLAERVLIAPDWREFTLYRAAPRDGTVTVTLALTGIGEVWLDDVTVNLWEPPVRQARVSEDRRNDE